MSQGNGTGNSTTAKNFKELSPEEKRALWEFSYGDQLVENIRSTGSHSSPLLFQLIAADLVIFHTESIEVQPETFSKLVERAGEDPDVFDVVKYACGFNLTSNENVTEDLKIVAGAILLGELKRPDGPGRTKYWYRDALIYHGLKKARELGYHASRSHGSQKDCGVSLVLEAFHRADETHLTFTAIENVWKARRKSGLEQQLAELEALAPNSHLAKSKNHQKDANENL